MVKNPLLAAWTGPYGGVPPFDKVQVTQFQSALETAMAQHQGEISLIANNPAPANFENTIAALERSGNTLSRVGTLFDIWTGSLSTPDVKKVETLMAPKLAAHGDAITQNSKLFARIETVYKSEENKKLNSEQQRLVWLKHTEFVLNGAQLSAENKQKVSQINQRMATLTTQFAQNQLADEEEDYLVISNRQELAGTPQSIIDDAASEAKRLKLTGKWVIANTRSAMEPLLQSSPNRKLREAAFRKWISRGDNPGPHNNNALVTEILKLRAERSKLLGFATYADWRLADTMAKTPTAAMDLMLKVWKPAVAQVHREVAEMQKVVDAEGGAFKIAPWDYRYYSEKVRLAKYDLDFNAVKPYLQLENVQAAMFWVAEQLFGFTFELTQGIPVFHPAVKVYRVLGADKKLVGLWYFDPYARPGKHSGAWMTDYREQERMDGKEIHTIVSNNSNFVQAKPGEPVLISWDDAVTMFHEFGHALHGLNSNVTYPSLSGTNVPRDYVEFPSQLYENWLDTPGVLKFLKDQNGRVIPAELVEKIHQARYFNQGFSTVEFLASAIVDMEMHLAGSREIDPVKFERDTLTKLGMPSEIVMRHRIPHFGHVFSGEGYAAGYYSYLWSQVLDYDAFEAFSETGNVYDKGMAKKLHDYIFSVGNTVDPAEAYRKFRGRDAKPDALLRARGFPLK